jgi:methanogenic corrinoid protein MtbC1
MSTGRAAAIYNVRVVVRETGLRPDTLRAWERRYGVPRPVRSEGHQRRYSQQDVDQLRWLVARQREGMTIGRAVDLWNQLVAKGEDPLQISPAVTTPPASVSSLHAIDDIRAAWVQACLAFDESTAAVCLTHAYALYTPEDVSVEVVARGLAEIGDLWYQAKASVHHEHFASEMVLRHFERLIAAAPPLWHSQHILVACAPGEQHSIAGLFISTLLRRHGWQVTFLGADVPAENVGAAIAQTQPDLVILLAQRLATAGNLLEIARRIAPLGPRLAYGGRIFNIAAATRAKTPGVFLGETVRQAVAATERILTRKDSTTWEPDDSDPFSPLRETFARAHPFIDAIVWRDLEERGLTQAHIVLGGNNLSPALAAALAFGDLTLLSQDIQWLNGFLTYRNMPSNLFSVYLAAYKRALGETLGFDGRVLVDLLERLEVLRSV